MNCWQKNDDKWNSEQKIVSCWLSSLSTPDKFILVESILSNFVYIGNQGHTNSIASS